MSILRRSLISIVVSFAKAVCSFGAGVLLARGLGPEEYGVFAFLISSFMALRGLLDMGTSSAFFTFISKVTRARSYVLYYCLWLLLQFLVSFTIIAVLLPDAWIDRLWAGEGLHRVLAAFTAVFIQSQIWQMVAQLGESQRLTTKVQLVNLAVAIVHLCLIGGFFAFDTISIERVFLFIAIEFSVATLVAFTTFSITYSKNETSAKEMWQEYWVYCLPLIPYAWMSVVASFADRWLLQQYGGAREQAYYAVATMFGSLSLLTAMSVMRIVWKEIAEAHDKGDRKKVASLYYRANRMLFVFAALVSGFLIPWVPQIIELTLGEQYQSGVVVMVLMFLYPIHQSIGQLNGTMYYALEMTGPYVVIGIVTMVVSTVLAYVLMAPPSSLVPGFGLASNGLAVKMILVQFVSVNFSIWWMSRKMDWDFQVWYQFGGILLFLGLGLSTYWLVHLVELSELAHVLLAATIYLLLSLILLFRFPVLWGGNQRLIRVTVGRMMQR
jgi:O-antigen/teichoic acid export membrane protein